jgi:outer membrane protein TolC
LLRRRPDVRRAEREAAAQSARIGIAESDLYPQLTITGSISLGAEDFVHLLNADSLGALVGPRFRWNLLNYGRIQNNVRVQEARFLQRVAEYQQTVLEANEEVENAILAFLREQERLEALNRSVQATEQAVETAVYQYEEGVVDYQRVLDSQRTLVLQRDSFAQSQGQVAQNLVAVYKALGGGWQMGCAACSAPLAAGKQPDRQPAARAGQAPLPVQPQTRLSAVNVANRRPSVPK